MSLIAISTCKLIYRCILFSVGWMGCVGFCGFWKRKPYVCAMPLLLHILCTGFFNRDEHSFRSRGVHPLLSLLSAFVTFPSILWLQSGRAWCLVDEGMVDIHSAAWDFWQGQRPCLQVFSGYEDWRNQDPSGRNLSQHCSQHHKTSVFCVCVHTYMTCLVHIHTHTCIILRADFTYIYTYMYIWRINSVVTICLQEKKNYMSEKFYGCSIQPRRLKGVW